MGPGIDHDGGVGPDRKGVGVVGVTPLRSSDSSLKLREFFGRNEMRS